MLQDGDPLLGCFGCGKRATRQNLVLFPWWHIHADAFVTMYYCKKCVHKAQYDLTTMLKTKQEDRLDRFIAFLDQQRLRDETLQTMTGREALAYSLDIIERITTGEILLNP